MNRLCRSAAAVVLLFTLSACSYVKTPVVAFSDDGQYLPRDVGDGLVQSRTPLIPDVPIPVGFKADRELSHWHYDGQVRVVNHVYQGHANPGEASAFYQRVLPSKGWTMLETQGVGDTTVLRYSKGPERLTITTDQGWGIATITINIDAR